jgi:hypothetical protein
MKYLIAEKQQMQYYFLVQMDDNPNNKHEFTWGLTPPQGQTETQYLANIKREIGLLVEDELSRINPQSTPEATPLSGF